MQIYNYRESHDLLYVIEERLMVQAIRLNFDSKSISSTYLIILIVYAR